MFRFVIGTSLAVLTLSAQTISNWPAPLYWQPGSVQEEKDTKPAIARMASDVQAPAAFDSEGMLSIRPSGPPARAPISGPLPLVAVTPCRVVDTRPEAGLPGAFGAPAMAGGTSRTIPIPQSGCGIPSGAAAYSLNVTVVPFGPLSYLTMWPTGSAMPVVSTLNAFQGQVVANAAIVPAGTNGAIDVFVTDRTNVIIDINGYFAAGGGSGTGSSLTARYLSTSLPTLPASGQSVRVNFNSKDWDSANLVTTGSGWVFRPPVNAIYLLAARVHLPDGFASQGAIRLKFMTSTGPLTLSSAYARARTLMITEIVIGLTTDQYWFEVEQSSGLDQTATSATVSISGLAP